jgi:hypothetical protein
MKNVKLIFLLFFQPVHLTCIVDYRRLEILVWQEREWCEIRKR